MQWWELRIGLWSAGTSRCFSGVDERVRRGRSPNGGMVGIETSIFRRHECTGQALRKSVGSVRHCPAAYIVNVEELLVESWWDFGCPHSFCLVDSFVDSVFSWREIFEFFFLSCSFSVVVTVAVRLLLQYSSMIVQQSYVLLHCFLCFASSGS